MPGPSSLREFLRSRAAAILWLLAASFVLLLAWQAVVGWPFHRTLDLPLSAAADVGPSVYRGKLPDLPSLDWNLPWTRFFVADREFRQVRLAEQVLTADFPVSRLKGRGFVLRDPASATLVGRCRVQFPWILSGVATALAGALFLTWGGLLLWARNPCLLPLGNRTRRWPVTPILIGLALAAVIFMRLAAFSFPTWEDDSNDYCRPVFQWLSGQKVTPTDRPLGYPLIVAVVLKLFEDFRAVVYWQMFASVCAATALAAVLAWSGRRLFAPGWLRTAAGLAAAAAVVFFGLHERTLQREWNLLPEAGAALWIACQLGLGWRLVALPLSRGRAWVEFAFFCAAGWMIFFTKSNWGFAVGVMPVPIVFAAWLCSSTRRDFVVRLTGGAITFLSVTGLAAYVQSLTPLNTEASVQIRSRVFVCWHADLVRLELTRRLAKNPPEESAALLREIAEAIDTEFALTKRDGPGVYDTLGWDGDRLYYHGIWASRIFRRLSPPRQAEVCRDLFFGALRRHPMMYMRKVLRQWALYFKHPCGGATIHHLAIGGSYARSVELAEKPRPDLPPTLRERYRPAVEHAGAVLRGPWPTPPRVALSLRMDAIFACLNLLFAWSLALPLLVAVAALLWRPWRDAVPWRELAPVLGVALWATGSAAACALSSAAMQALEIQRYMDLYLPLTLLSMFLWPLLAIAIIRPIWRSRCGAVGANHFGASAETTSAGSSSSEPERAK